MPRRPTVAHTAADPTVEFVPLEIAGATYKLAFDFNAIATAEELTGLNLLQGAGALLFISMEEDIRLVLVRYMQHGARVLSASELRALLYAALQTAHPQITLADAGKLIGSSLRGSFALEKVPDIQRALLKAWGASVKDPEEGKRPDPPAAGAAAESSSDTANSGASAGA